MQNKNHLDDFTKAARIAGRLLSRRIHSSAELGRKLGQKGFPQNLINQLISELQKQKLLNDANFAEVYAVELIKKGVGPRKIRNEMKRRGLADEIIENELKKYSESEDDEFSTARKALKRKMKTFEREPDIQKRKARIFRFLSSRGFNSSTVFKVIDEVIKKGMS